MTKAKTNTCKDCGAPCGKRSQRCQPCSNIRNGKSRPRHPKLCEKCGAELAKGKYKLCHACNMKVRWSNEEYKIKTTANIRASFDARWADPTIRKKIIKDLTSHHGTSKLEKRVAKIGRQFGFEPSVAVGRYLADILNENKKIIVEVNGDLWHCNPKFWKADDIHPNKKVSAQVIWDRDAKRKLYLESLGYKIFVLWEDDIMKGKDSFIKEFFEKLNEAKN
jgi:very-short-patch-repair endonuclease